jgi:excisionase family DNA binding protein
MAKDQKLLTSRGAARILGVTDQTIRRWAEMGTIRHICLPSGQLRFEPADIEAIRRPVEATG